MTAYYNELDPGKAEHLRFLMRRGLIAPGEVDERSIVDVRGDDLRGPAVVEAARVDGEFGSCYTCEKCAVRGFLWSNGDEVTCKTAARRLKARKESRT